MRLVVALVLLLVQLRPLAGAAVCLEQTMSSQECAMPEHGPALTEPTDEAPSGPAGCQTTALCSPAGVAVRQSAIAFGLVQAPIAFDVGLEPTHLSGPALVPPFHPPRV
ncbi:MAG: hypothetical protein ACREOF_06720 [Gemmatimonadales bacterium]